MRIYKNKYVCECGYRTMYNDLFKAHRAGHETERFRVRETIKRFKVKCGEEEKEILNELLVALDYKDEKTEP